MRQRRHGHVRQRSPGTWEVRYTLGTEPGTGKRRTITTTVKGERKDAKRELRRLLRTLDTGQHVDPTRMTVNDWLTLWLTTVRNEVSPKTHERYADLVRCFLIPELGAHPLAKLTPVHIQTAYNKWAVGGRRDRKAGGLSPQTRRHIHRVLKSALSRAVKQLMIGRNPADSIEKLPKVDRRSLTVLTAEQSARLLEDLAHTRAYWPVLIALSTGMRRGEILALRWRNVDLDRALITIVESLEQVGGRREGIRFKLPKSGKARAVTLPSFTVEELRRLRREQAKKLLALGIPQSGDTLLCGCIDGKPMIPGSLTREFWRLTGRLKDIPRIRFHDLRHTHATELLRAGVQPKVVQERLGHSSISITMDVYSHLSETLQLDAAIELDRVFRSALKKSR
jgi:integrase